MLYLEDYLESKLSCICSATFMYAITVGGNGLSSISVLARYLKTMQINLNTTYMHWLLK